VSERHAWFSILWLDSHFSSSHATAVVAHCSEVRKQTCDLITLMEMGAATSQYYMFMEDDFRVYAPAAVRNIFHRSSERGAPRVQIPHPVATWHGWQVQPLRTCQPLYHRQGEPRAPQLAGHPRVLRHERHHHALRGPQFAVQVPTRRHRAPAPRPAVAGTAPAPPAGGARLYCTPRARVRRDKILHESTSCRRGASSPLILGQPNPGSTGVSGLVAPHWRSRE